MAREAEVDEPFLVEQPRGLLQQLDPAPVVLDEVVVGGEDITTRSARSMSAGI